VNVNAIEQRPEIWIRISGSSAVCSGTRALDAKISAGARIHRRGEHEPSREKSPKRPHERSSTPHRPPEADALLQAHSSETPATHPETKHHLANETSPGLGTAPPPINPASLMCDGASDMDAVPPATVIIQRPRDTIIVSFNGFFQRHSGKYRGNPLRSMVFCRHLEVHKQQVLWSAGASHFQSSV